MAPRFWSFHAYGPPDVGVLTADRLRGTGVQSEVVTVYVPPRLRPRIPQSLKGVLSCV